MTEAKLLKEDTCPKCQSDDINWAMQHTEYDCTVTPNKLYHVTSAKCNKCNTEFKTWSKIAYSFTKWD